eukprot:6204841-Pleurochrysis_carterae.AAC.1
MEEEERKRRAREAKRVRACGAEGQSLTSREIELKWCEKTRSSSFRLSWMIRAITRLVMSLLA